MSLSTGAKVALTTVGGVVTVIAITGVAFVSTSNSINQKQNSVDNQLSNIQVVLQRRNDLIPNIVKTASASQTQEKEVYGKIADARTQYYNANKDYSSSTDTNAKAKALGEQQSALNIMVGSITENYPDLKSNTQLSSVMNELEGTENRISVERRKYNDTVKDYNTKITTFPASLVASMTGHGQKLNYFTADTSAQKAPEVNFGK